MANLNAGEVIPTSVMIVYALHQYPINFNPEIVVERYDQMTDDAGKPVNATLATDKIYDRELCESGVENKKLADTTV